MRNLIDHLFKYQEWNAYINQTYSSRFTELIEVIDLIAFNNLDKKILNYLEKKKEALNTSTLSVTHQQIAAELNTHREAVSRLLRSMEQKGIVKLVEIPLRYFEHFRRFLILKKSLSSAQNFLGEPASGYLDNSIVIMLH